MEEKEEQKEKIEAMFRSSDPELVKLAIQMCHSLRIDYYILLFGRNAIYRKGHIVSGLRLYSVNRDVLEQESEKSIFYTKIWQIKLEKWKK